MKSIFITGGTGGLGKELIHELLKDFDIKLYILVRNKNKNEIKKLLFLNHNQAKDLNDIEKRVEFIHGAIEYDRLGINESEYSNLCQSINEIFHCAAITGFNLTHEEAISINVNGTQNILDFALKCKKLVKFNYISSTFILGNAKFKLKECDFDINQDFNNAYEKSKFLAEKLVRSYLFKIPVIIFRPSVITGSYSDGSIINFKLIYEAIRLFSKNLIDEFPGNKKTNQNFVPVDIAAKEISLLSRQGKISKTYHITSPNSTNCYWFLEFAAKYIGYKNPRWIRPEKFNISKISPVKKAIISPYLPYFNYAGSYNSYETHNELKINKFNPPNLDESYFVRILDYCLNEKFIRKHSKL